MTRRAVKTAEKKRLPRRIKKGRGLILNHYIEGAVKKIQLQCE
jgi:hypothetical protein